MAVSVLIVAAAGAHAGRSWDRAANVGEAASRLVEMHRAQGSRGVMKFLDACYKTHTLSSEYKAALEACLAQDYMHTRVLVEIYSRLPEDARTSFDAPETAKIAQALNHRFNLVMQQYAIPETEALELKQSIEAHGLPVFVKGVMPQGENRPGSDDGSKDGTR